VTTSVVTSSVTSSDFLDVFRFVFVFVRVVTSSSFSSRSPAAAAAAWSVGDDDMIGELMASTDIQCTVHTYDLTRGSSQTWLKVKIPRRSCKIFVSVENLSDCHKLTAFHQCFFSLEKDINPPLPPI